MYPKPSFSQLRRHAASTACGSWSVFHNFVTIKISSRFTTPSFNFFWMAKPTSSSFSYNRAVSKWRYPMSIAYSVALPASPNDCEYEKKNSKNYIQSTDFKYVKSMETSTSTCHIFIQINFSSGYRNSYIIVTQFCLITFKITQIKNILPQMFQDRILASISHYSFEYSVR